MVSIRWEQLYWIQNNDEVYDIHHRKYEHQMFIRSVQAIIYHASHPHNTDSRVFWLWPCTHYIADYIIVNSVSKFAMKAAGLIMWWVCDSIIRLTFIDFARMLSFTKAISTLEQFINFDPRIKPLNSKDTSPGHLLNSRACKSGQVRLMLYAQFDIFGKELLFGSLI